MDRPRDYLEIVDSGNKNVWQFNAFVICVLKIPINVVYFRIEWYGREFFFRVCDKSIRITANVCKLICKFFNVYVKFWNLRNLMCVQWFKKWNNVMAIFSSESIWSRFISDNAIEKPGQTVIMKKETARSLEWTQYREKIIFFKKCLKTEFSELKNQLALKKNSWTEKQITE